MGKGELENHVQYRESGCVFKADLEHIFLSPRLAYERMRIAKKVFPGEMIINIFAGVGCFSTLIAKVQPRTKIYLSFSLKERKILSLLPLAALSE